MSESHANRDILKIITALPCYSAAGALAACLTVHSYDSSLVMMNCVC